MWKTHLLSFSHTVQYANMNKKILIILIVSFVLVIGVALVIFTREKPQPAEQEISQPLVLPPIEKEPAGFGGQVYEQVQSPAEQLPETNPFEAQTNPFEKETNPLKATYINPFQ